MKKKLLVLVLSGMASLSCAKVLATVGGTEITDDYINKQLNIATDGRVKFDSLREDQKKAVINDAAMELAIEKNAKKEGMDTTDNYREQVELCGKQVLRQSYLKKIAASVPYPTDKELKDHYQQRKAFLEGSKEVIVSTPDGNQQAVNLKLLGQSNAQLATALGAAKAKAKVGELIVVSAAKNVTLPAVPTAEQFKIMAQDIHNQSVRAKMDAVLKDSGVVIKE